MACIPHTKRTVLFTYFLDLIELADSFDQLTKLALILDQIYTPNDPEHRALYKFTEIQCRHLKSLRDIGVGEVHDQGASHPAGAIGS